MGKREKQQRPVVVECISRHLGRRLRDVAPRANRATHDFETLDAARPTIAIELKELVPAEFLSVQKAVLGDPGWDSTVLSHRWSGLLEELCLSSRLIPTPSFPDDPPVEEIEAMARFGLMLTPKVEVERAHRARQSLASRGSTLVKNLSRDIEPHLAVLERFGVLDTRTGALPPARDDFLAVHLALVAIAQRTGGAMFHAHPPIGAERPGIDLCFGFSAVRTGDANVVADRVQLWLDSPESGNLRDSLANSERDERHAALWLSTDAEAHSAAEQGVRFCPTKRMDLPGEIDVLWLFIGPVVLRYRDVWSSALLARCRP